MIGRTVLRSAVVFIATSLLATAAQAIVGPGLFRAYVSPTGSDANPCTLGAPCRLLPAALAAVADGGEIWMLDSANYNTATVDITKSVTILAVPGALGSVVAAGGGSAINISTAGVKVALRNLVVVPLPNIAGSAHGVSMSNGAELTIENCLLANLLGAGVVVTTPASVHVTDTTIRGTADAGLILQDGARGTVTRSTFSGNAGQGILASGYAGGTTTTADIADSTLDGNANGVYGFGPTATAAVNISVRNSRLVRNSGNGALASTSGGSVTLSVSDNVISNNGTGIQASGVNSKVVASGNTVSANGTALTNYSGLLESAGNNVVRNNTSANIGAITVISMQ